MPSVQVNDVADNEVSLPEGGDSTFIGSATSTVGSLQVLYIKLEKATFIANTALDL